MNRRSRPVRPRASLLGALAVCAAAMLALDAAWVPLKAELGQWLLERAWQQRLAGERAPRPWPWADTTPVGVLEIPRLGLRQLVLAGAAGRNLAWGPAATGDLSADDRIISGHRDTHFAALRDLRPGDRVRLRTPDETRNYRVAWLDIVDSRRQRLVLEADRRRLTLVTCWPFGALRAGGPLRLVVTALPVEAPGRPAAESWAQRSSQGGTGRSLPRRNPGSQSLD